MRPFMLTLLAALATPLAFRGGAAAPSTAQAATAWPRNPAQSDKDDSDDDDDDDDKGGRRLVSGSARSSSPPTSHGRRWTPGASASNPRAMRSPI
jgi:hypothetical protein